LATKGGGGGAKVDFWSQWRDYPTIAVAVFAITCMETIDRLAPQLIFRYKLEVQPIHLLFRYLQNIYTC